MIKKSFATSHSIIVVVCILACSVLIELAEMYISADASQIFRFQRSDILSGQIWRILTGHIDHLGWEHLLLNAVFFALISLLFERFFKSLNVLFFWFLSCLFISALMLLFSPNLLWYVGLSGSLYSLLVIGLMVDRSYPISLRALIIAVLIAKVVLEQSDMNVSAISEFIGGPVAVDSHMYGLIVGVAMSVVILLLDYKKAK